MAYLDTSILGSFYCLETLSPAVNQALASLSVALISPLVEVEFISLLSMKVRTGDLDRSAAQQTRQQYLKHKSHRLFRLVSVGENEYQSAARLLAQFNSSLHALDALHLATASANRQPIWTTDKLMATSAKSLGIPCKLITL